MAQVQALTAQTKEVQLSTRQVHAALSLIRAIGGRSTVKTPVDEQQVRKATERNSLVSISRLLLKPSRPAQKHAGSWGAVKKKPNPC